MAKIFVGAITAEGERLLKSYLKTYMPDAVIEPLKSSGIKGKIKNQAKRSDVALVIIDESLYHECEEVAGDVLSLPKVHKYINDDGLRQFLITKFGSLDDESMLSSQEANQGSNLTRVVDDSDMIDISVGVRQTDDNELIAELREKLAKSEMLVRNLTLQINDGKEDADDTAILVARIKELETLIEQKDSQLDSMEKESYVELGKIAKAEKVLAETDELKKQLSQANDEKSQLVFEKSKLEEEINKLQINLKDINSQLVELDSIKAELERRNADVEKLEDKVHEKESEISIKTAEIGLLQTKINEQLQKASNSISEVAKLKDTLAAKTLEYDNMVIDLQVKENELTTAKNQAAQLQIQLDSKTAELSSKVIELETATAKIAELDSNITHLTSEITSLNLEVTSLRETIDKKDIEIAEGVQKATDLQASIDLVQEDLSRLEQKDSEINLLNTNLQEQKNTILKLSQDLADLQTKLTEKEQEIANIRNEFSDVNATITAKDSEIERLENEKFDIERKISLLEAELIDLKLKYSDLQKESSSLGVSISTKDKQIEGYLVDIEKLENKVRALESGGSDDSASSIELEKKLLEEQRKSTRLETELNSIKAELGDGSGSNMKLEIIRLKTELDNAKKNAISQKEYDALKRDLETERSLRIDLELSQATSNESSGDRIDTLFSKFGGISAPKAAFDGYIEPPVIPTSSCEFICVAGGSNESVSSVYKTLRKTCESNPSKRIIILDLVTDTSIDSEFGIEKVNPALDWLTDKDTIKSCICNTKFNTVKVISTGLAFMNDLFLLRVDWNKRIRNLADLKADIVILNVGYLNNLVSKVLFSTFSQIMKTYVIAKSTPGSLRTTLLVMMGFLNLDSKVTVACVDYKDSSADIFYKKLTQRCNAYIIQNEGLKL